jgi:hypothetical protein
MKFEFQVKGRAALREAIEAAAKAEIDALKLSDADAAALVKTRSKKALEDVKVWSADGTTFTIAIDTDAATCEVVAC